MRKTAVRAVALAAVCFLSVFGTCSYAKEATSEPIQIVVLGDSIAKGYCGANKPELSCYGQTVAEEIAQGAGKSYLYQNYAKNGLATREFNEKVLKGQEVQDSLSGADVILITMGSNDLLNEFKKTAQEILNTDTKFKSADEALKEVTEHVKSNPLLVFRIIDALGNWDYQEFETQWIEAMDTISSCKKEEAQIVVTNIYNPVKQMELPGTMNQVVGYHREYEPDSGKAKQRVRISDCRSGEFTGDKACAEGRTASGSGRTGSDRRNCAGADYRV